MLDKKGKLFGKISIVDILIVVIFCIAIAGARVAWVKISNKTVLTENKALVQNNVLDTLEVSLRLKGVRQMTLDAIKIGDEVYMKDTGKMLGKVVAVTTEPAKEWIYDAKGRAFYAEKPERFDVVMVVQVPGKRLQNGFYTADNIHLVYDSNIEIITPTIQTTVKTEMIKIVSGA